ncbi:MAG: hypothetical protein ACFFA1_06770 [Promethearchaeota archaeon]
MRLECIESEEIKKDGLWWGVLKCLLKTLDRAGYKIPRSTSSKLEVIRKIIETRSHSIRALEGLLNQVEDILTDKLIYIFRAFSWYQVLLRSKNGDLTINEAMEIPHMREMVKRFKFLSYCMPTRMEPPKAI